MEHSNTDSETYHWLFSIPAPKLDDSAVPLTTINAIEANVAARGNKVGSLTMAPIRQYLGYFPFNGSLNRFFSPFPETIAHGIWYNPAKFYAGIRTALQIAGNAA